VGWLLFGLGCLLIGFVVYSVRTGANDWFSSDRVERVGSDHYVVSRGGHNRRPISAEQAAAHERRRGRVNAVFGGIVLAFIGGVALYQLKRGGRPRNSGWPQVTQDRPPALPPRWPFL
jgi:hypothetical protein